MYRSSATETIPSAAAQLSSVDIAIIPNREGQILRNDLMDRFYPRGVPSAPSATLKIAPLVETKTDLDLTKSSDVTRAQVTLNTTLTLEDQSGEILLTKPITAIGSYNTLKSEFATRVTEEGARQSALHDLARQIEFYISLYYSGKK